MKGQKVAVVLGVGPGLGAAVSHRFAREGFAVVLMARDKKKLTAVQKDIENAGGTAVSFLLMQPTRSRLSRRLMRFMKSLGAWKFLCIMREPFVKGAFLI